MKKLQDLTYNEKLKIALKLKDSYSFFLVYFEFLPKHKTQKDCYTELNSIYIEFFGSDKYKNFDSFRACMYRDYFRKTKNQNNDKK